MIELNPRSRKAVAASSGGRGKESCDYECSFSFLEHRFLPQQSSCSSIFYRVTSGGRAQAGALAEALSDLGPFP